jgi:hypothetical protein
MVPATFNRYFRHLTNISLSPLDPAAFEIALTAAKLTDEDKQIALAVLKGLVSQYPKSK